MECHVGLCLWRSGHLEAVREAVLRVEPEHSEAGPAGARRLRRDLDGHLRDIDVVDGVDAQAGGTFEDVLLPDVEWPRCGRAAQARHEHVGVPGCANGDPNYVNV